MKPRIARQYCGPLKCQSTPSLSLGDPELNVPPVYWIKEYRMIFSSGKCSLSSPRPHLVSEAVRISFARNLLTSETYDRSCPHCTRFLEATRGVRQQFVLECPRKSSCESLTALAAIAQSSYCDAVSYGLIAMGSYTYAYCMDRFPSYSQPQRDKRASCYGERQGQGNHSTSFGALWNVFKVVNPSTGKSWS